MRLFEDLFNYVIPFSDEDLDDISFYFPLYGEQFPGATS